MRGRPDRKRTSFGRSKARLTPKERVLIVCEGSKTEPIYFNDFARDLGLSGTDVRVYGDECGSDPVSVVRFAAQVAKEDRGFDHVYCVVDKDKHPNILSAISLAHSTKIKGTATFDLIMSVPCFEYWLISHFEYYAKPFAASGNLSVGAAFVKELTKHLPNYGKAARDIYAQLKPKLPTALANAARREEECRELADDNPSTKVHVVALRLSKIAEEAS